MAQTERKSERDTSAWQLAGRLRTDVYEHLEGATRSAIGVLLRGADEATGGASTKWLGELVNGETKKAKKPKLIDYNYIKKSIAKMRKIPALVLNTAGPVIAIAGAALSEMDVRSAVPDSSRLGPAMVVVGLVLVFSGERLVKREARRRSNKVLKKIQEGIENGSIKTYNAVAALNEVDVFLREYHTRGIRNVKFARATGSTLMKIAERLDANKITQVDASQLFSNLMENLSVEEQDMISDAVFAVRKRGLERRAVVAKALMSPPDRLAESANAES
ncbi:MAG: hypothetical protein M1528_01660 [Candidatus Marsarchaeota archaeon]|jgi:hypothetical protein|nr:hypothetical protein [Candidatus Marsarchaeota archaeon]MCL5115220.1 hypothetical protein [Candidatus Marsarchaeota archaeon]